MPITARQREWRRRHVGSSDSAPIMAVHPFRVSGDVYWTKVQPLDDDDTATEAMEIGNMVEPVLVDWASKKVGCDFIKNQSRADGVLAANHDGLDQKRSIGCEAKVTSVSDNWGEEGTDQIPEHIIIQCQHQMVVSGLEAVYVPVLMVAHRLSRKLYKVVRNDELISVIVEADLRFWNDYVLTQTPPPDSVPSMEVIRHIRRVPDKVVDVPDELFILYRSGQMVLSDVRKKVDKAKSALIASLGDAEGGHCAAGDLTYLESARKGYSVEPCTYRTLRLQPREDQPCLPQKQLNQES